MKVATASAPGRVEVLGNHTDYNQGVVLAAAINRGVTVTAASRADEVVSLSTSFSEAKLEIPLREIQPQKDERWVNYPLGVIHQFQRAGHTISGFEANFTSDLPAGAGLSSSAALEVATANVLMAVHEIRLEPLAVAKLCQRAESEFVGIHCGLLDQVASIFGQADHLVFLDCKTEEITTIPFPSDLALIVARSGVQHDLLLSHYNTRRNECSAAARALGVTSLREVTLEQLGPLRARPTPILYRRAIHVVGENDRVLRAVDALRKGDPITLGALMNASHESSRTNFDNSTPELDLLVSIARSLPGVLGSRLTGGGFGGSTVTLTQASHATEVSQRLSSEYERQTGRAALAVVCRVSDGATRI